MLLKHARHIEIVYYVRHIADYIVSLYGEDVRRRAMTGNLSAFIRRYKRSFRLTLENYQAVIGADAISVFLYDTHRDDIFGSFLTNIGLEALDAPAVENVNRSLTRKELEIVRRLNAARANKIAVRKLAVSMSNLIARDREPFRLTQAELALLDDKFRSDIDWINAHYLNDDTLLLRSDGIELAEAVSVRFDDDDEYYLAILESMLEVLGEEHAKLERTQNLNTVLKNRIAELERGLVNKAGGFIGKLFSRS